MTARRVPIFSTIVVIAAVLTMVGLGIWQLQRKGEKEALIARYEAAQAQRGFQFIEPSAPEAAYTKTIEYCADPAKHTVVAGRNAKGQSGWIHVVRCQISGPEPRSKASAKEFLELFAHHSGKAETVTDAEVAKLLDDLKDAPDVQQDFIQYGDVVLGWSQSSDPLAWSGGWVAGTVVPTGELGFRIVADPPLAGLEANAKPDPGDLPNNHLAYAGQWFFFALTALGIYALALRRRRG
ncbi:SURF1 family cytochrome oxidase biogenesis protein [Erythrobacter donghaensis]|jgi:surfeit locus 1 family protein|uniref:SURF1 family cytochrome oxidase biogenesis protein n=1 Tax=Erythrobacter donghaensis TaxID=267135 RepID=UPI000938F465|nr:SURF1 family cytochrome oxidase biogenesis protein [Erythrobacter donghaensis]